MSIRLSGLGWTTPDGVTLFRCIDLVFGAERTGLVGRNGAGKSTLLKLIAGELTPHEGAIARQGEVRMLRQSEAPPPGMTIADAFHARAALERLTRLEEGAGDADDLAEADWALPERIDAAIAEAGLPPLSPAHALAALSGGQRTRVALAALTFGAPTTLLLDEPTNNLDSKGRDAIAGLLARHRGGVIVASHDRALLRHMDRIVEISATGTRIYGGGWDMHEAQRAEERAAAQSDLTDAERRLRQTQRESQQARERQARHAKPGKTLRIKGGAPRIVIGLMKNRAEGTAGRAERLAEKREADAEAALDTARARVDRNKPMTATLSPSELASSSHVLSFDGVTGGPAPSLSTIRDLSFSIVGPERVAITGPNGAGKTTVLRLATSALTPLAGRIRLSVAAVMLDQDVSLLDPSATIRDNFHRLNPADGENICRAALARFLFRADAALRETGTLSGGEKLRAGLACVLGGSHAPGLVILDEPTNHLDLAAIAAVEDGLNAYDGAILAVSHDEAFLTAIGIQRRISLMPGG